MEGYLTAMLIVGAAGSFLRYIIPDTRENIGKIFEFISTIAIVLIMLGAAISVKESWNGQNTNINKLPTFTDALGGNLTADKVATELGKEAAQKEIEKMISDAFSMERDMLNVELVLSENAEEFEKMIVFMSEKKDASFEVALKSYAHLYFGLECEIEYIF